MHFPVCLPHAIKTGQGMEPTARIMPSTGVQYLLLVVGGPKTNNDSVVSLCAFLARNTLRAHCLFLGK